MSNHVEFAKFEMDPGVVAPVIYGSQPHRVTDCGVILSSEVTAELRSFLARFKACTGIVWRAHYRIDAYFNEGQIAILEINTAFVDGWGTALNLSRAAGITVDPRKLVFPAKFTALESVYDPELELFVQELKLRGISAERIGRISHPRDLAEPTYVYGRMEGDISPYLYPRNGLGMDNKIFLAYFSREWHGSLVNIPTHYFARSPWEDVPRDSVLKFCDKGSPECRRAGWSVSFGKPRGKAPFLRRCYDNRDLLAQDYVAPTRREGQNCQLVILAIDSEPVTGYVQYGWRKIVNDDSVHGPLQLR